MIKPINVSPINTTSQIYFECESCGLKNTIAFTNRVINTDRWYDLKELEREQCSDCGVVLGKQDKN